MSTNRRRRSQARSSRPSRARPGPAWYDVLLVYDNEKAAERTYAMDVCSELRRRACQRICHTDAMLESTEFWSDQTRDQFLSRCHRLVVLLSPGLMQRPWFVHCIIQYAMTLELKQRQRNVILCSLTRDIRVPLDISNLSVFLYDPNFHMEYFRRLAWLIQGSVYSDANSFQRNNCVEVPFDDDELLGELPPSDDEASLGEVWIAESEVPQKSSVEGATSDMGSWDVTESETGTRDSCETASSSSGGEPSDDASSLESWYDTNDISESERSDENCLEERVQRRKKPRISGSNKAVPPSERHSKRSSESDPVIFMDIDRTDYDSANTNDSDLYDLSEMWSSATNDGDPKFSTFGNAQQPVLGDRPIASADCILISDDEDDVDAYTLQDMAYGRRIMNKSG